MSNTSLISNGLYQLLAREYTTLSLRTADGERTQDPAEAVTLEFPFIDRGVVAATVTISLEDEGTLKLMGSNSVNSDRWFELINNIRRFAKANRLQPEIGIQGKSHLDKRDSKDTPMEESSLYGSSKSSYQNMESTKLIIRHSKRIQEGSANSRTRNIEALYIQNESGERFRYPYPHLSGARAMQRHVANGGNPYDHFGHYVISLSEQVYNYRKVSNLLARKTFTENSEVFEIAEKSKKKVKDIKKVLERIQKQGGYLLVRENFTTFKKKEMDEETLNELRSAFTTQQFNEELIELFPYISDLMGEATDPRDSRPETWRPNNTGYAWDRLDTRLPSHPKHSAKAKAGQQAGLKSNIKRDLGSHGPKGHLPEATDPRDSLPQTYRPNDTTPYSRDRLATRMPSDPKDSKARKAGKQSGLKHSIKDALGKHGPKGHLPEEQEIDEISDKLANKVKFKRAKNYAAADDNATGGSPEEEKAWNKLSKNSDIMNKRSNKKQMEAKDDVPDDVFFADPKNAPSADWVAQDAKAKSFPTRGDAAQKHGGLIGSLEKAVQDSPFIEVEPYSKEFIMKAIAITDKQLKQLEAQALEPTRDRNAANQIKWGLEKATARMGILQKRLETAELGTSQNSVAIEHLAKHIKNNDALSNLLLTASDEYNSMASADKKRIINVVRQIQSKQKYVALFTNESIAFTDLEMMLSESTTKLTTRVETIDPLAEFITALRKAIGEDEEEDDDDSDDEAPSDDEEEDDDDSELDDDCDCETDEEDMVKNRPTKADRTGDPKDILQFVLSLYNKEEGTFPRGKEGVVISAKKEFEDEFGEDAERIARMAVDKLMPEVNPHDMDMSRMRQLAGMTPPNNF